ncbi:hypothetical protein EC957_003150 [Mortierella hygrophila]|uniref:Uncharacterized protein n=1 Tax=Mortierella hygrophila TaxID=979708 RepID=A0A9P6FGF4_9FUNG|nr:hypothetical protein EC957_003150 [Mortierella hygrophila]
MLLERILDTFDGSWLVKALTVASNLPDWFFQLFLPVMTNLQSINISRMQGNSGPLVAELLAEHTNNLRTVKISSTTPNWMMSFLDRMPDTVTNLHVAPVNWKRVFEGVILNSALTFKTFAIIITVLEGLCKTWYLRLIGPTTNLGSSTSTEQALG